MRTHLSWKLEKLIAGVTVRQTNRPVGDPRSSDSSTAKIKASPTNSRTPIGRIHEARNAFSMGPVTRVCSCKSIASSVERLVNLSPSSGFTATSRD